MADDLDQSVASPNLQDFADAILSKVKTPQNADYVLNLIQQGLTEFFKIAVMIIAQIGKPVVLGAAEGITEGMSNMGGSYAPIAGATLSEMFGREITVPPGGGGGADGGVGAAAAAAFFQNIIGPTTTLTPSDEGAKRFMGMGLNLAIQGWFRGVMFEMLSQVETLELVKGERFADVVEDVTSALGLSRLARTVMHPLVNDVVATPFQWQVSKTFTPKLLSEAMAVQQFLRGLITRDQLNEELARQGWDLPRIEAFIAATRKRVSESDIVWAVLHHVMTDDTAMQLLRDDGYEDFVSGQRIAIERMKTVQPMLEQVYGEIENAYIAGHADDADLQSAALAAYPDDTIRSVAISLSQAKRKSRLKRISKSDIEAAVKRNAASITEYRDWLEQENYDPDSAALLEVLLAETIKDAGAATLAKATIAKEKAAAKKVKDDAAAKKAADLAAGAGDKSASLNFVKEAAILGIVPVDAFAVAAREAGYHPADAALMASVVQKQRDDQLAKEAKQQQLATSAAATKVGLGTLQQAALAGSISTQEFAARLKQGGFSDADVALLTSLVTTKIAAAAAVKTAHDAAAAAAANKGLNLSEAEHAVLAGVWTMAQFATWLSNAKFDPTTQAVLAATLQSKVNTQAAAAAKNAQVAGELATKGISLKDLETAVIHGDRPIGDVRAVLVKQRYSQADQDTLIDLLQDKIDAYAAAQQKRSAVVAATKAKPLSYAQIERAVITGVLNVNDAGDYLARAGYSDADVVTLQQLLVEQVNQARATQATRDLAAAAGARAGIDLGALEDAILAGTSTIDDYDRALRQLNVSAADRTALERALQLRMQQQGDAQQLAGVVDAQLKKKNLSLGDWRAAVKAHLRTTDDFTAFLLQEGFDQADAGVLVALLEQQIAKAGAKGSSSTPPPSTSSSAPTSPV